MQKALKILLNNITPDNESDVKQAIQLLACFEDIKRDIMSNTCETIGVTVCEISDGLPYDMFQCKLSVTRDESKFTEVYSPVLPVETSVQLSKTPKVKVNSLYKDMTLTDLRMEIDTLRFISQNSDYSEKLAIGVLLGELWTEIAKKRVALLEQVDFSNSFDVLNCL